MKNMACSPSLICFAFPLLRVGQLAVACTAVTRSTTKEGTCNACCGVHFFVENRGLAEESFIWQTRQRAWALP